MAVPKCACRDVNQDRNSYCTDHQEMAVCTACIRTSVPMYFLKSEECEMEEVRDIFPEFASSISEILWSPAEPEDTSRRQKMCLSLSELIDIWPRIKFQPVRHLPFRQYLTVVRSRVCQVERGSDRIISARVGLPEHTFHYFGMVEC